VWYQPVGRRCPSFSQCDWPQHGPGASPASSTGRVWVSKEMVRVALDRRLLVNVQSTRTTSAAGTLFAGPAACPLSYPSHSNRGMAALDAPPQPCCRRVMGVFRGDYLHPLFCASVILVALTFRLLAPPSVTDVVLLHLWPWNDPGNMFSWSAGEAITLVVALIASVAVLYASLAASTRLSFAQSAVFVLVLLVLAFVSAVCGSALQLHEWGVSYEIFAILLGAIVRNVGMMSVVRGIVNFFDSGADLDQFEHSFVAAIGVMSKVAIDTALILLAVPVQKLAEVGWLGLVPTILGTLTALLISIALLGALDRWLGCVDLESSLILAAATTVCGSSAASAVANALIQRPPDAAETEALLHDPQRRARAIKAKATNVIIVVNLWTLVQTLGLPLLVRMTTLGPISAGVFLGSTIDSTGFVVAALTLLDNPLSLTTGVTAKVVQNTVIALVAILIVRPWVVRLGRAGCCRTCTGPEAPDDPGEGALIHDAEALVAPEAAPPALARPPCYQTLLQSVPPFVFGFITLCVILTIVQQVNPPVELELAAGTSTASKICFAFGFVALGMSTTPPKSWRSLRQLFGLYVLVQLINIGVKLGLILGLYRLA
jgi:uncharacterized membrane protein YadS